VSRPSGVSDATLALVRILQHAYSGEKAAAYAYRGHWRSCRAEEERQRIREIEDEEWHHRRLVGGMLADLASAPSAVRELRAVLVGRGLGLLCHLAPWFIPMYGAGRLERGNVGEYEAAARHARDGGHEKFVDCLLAMAEVEWEHEAYFRAKVCGHSWARWVGIWPPLPPKAAIRAGGPPVGAQGKVESAAPRPSVASR
jgi:rubrerythrin